MSLSIPFAMEKLAWLSDNPFYTKRFAFFVGRRCRTSTIRDVARELHLDWKTVKDLDKEYMQEQLRRAGTPAPPASCPYGLSTTDRSNPGLYVNRGITLLLSC